MAQLIIIPTSIRQALLSDINQAANTIKSEAGAQGTYNIFTNTNPAPFALFDRLHDPHEPYTQRQILLTKSNVMLHGIQIVLYTHCPSTSQCLSINYDSDLQHMGTVSNDTAVCMQTWQPQ